MSPKPYERQLHHPDHPRSYSIGPYAYSSRPTRPNNSSSCSTPHWTKPKTNEKETSHDQQTNPNPCGGTRMTTAALIILTATIIIAYLGSL